MTNTDNLMISSTFKPLNLWRFEYILGYHIGYTILGIVIDQHSKNNSVQDDAIPIHTQFVSVRFLSFFAIDGFTFVSKSAQLSVASTRIL